MVTPNSFVAVGLRWKSEVAASRLGLVRLSFAVTLLLALLFESGPGRADVSQRKLSSYEQETVELVLGESGAVLEPEPSGKRLEGVDVVTLDVFERRDPAPAFLNWFHVTTQRAIIERELLLSVGQPFDPALAAESERNLRAFAQFSIVLLVPVRGKQPDTVRILVITKDVWSLRVSWDPNIVNGKLTSLSLAPAETNLFGTTQTVLATLYLDPNNYWVGGRYYVPRIGGSRIRANVGGNAIFNCQTNEIEGATGDFTYGQPLYSSLARWSWQTALTWSSSVVRGLVTDEEQPVCAGGVARRQGYATRSVEPSRTHVVRVGYRPVARADGGPSPAGFSGVDVAQRYLEQNELYFPAEYRSERLRGQVVLTRSWNLVDKFNLSTGLEVDRRAYLREPVPMDQTQLEAARYFVTPEGQRLREFVPLPPDAAQFAAAERSYLDTSTLRPSDRRVGPYAQLHAFKNSYVRVINYETLGLQEDVQVGHDLYLRLYPGFQPLSTRDLLGVFASAAYTTVGQVGMGRVLASSAIEYAGPTASDVGVRAAAHFATRDVGVGRFVYDAGLLYQPVQYLSGVYVLGGTGRLRGYKPSALFGSGLATWNHEFRSRPVRLFSVLTGFALFHDMGSVFNERFDGFRLRQGAGFGLRILAPQLDRDVFRIDFGFPLAFPASDDPAAQFTFTASFQQAFSTPVAFPNALLPQ